MNTVSSSMVIFSHFSYFSPPVHSNAYLLLCRTMYSTVDSPAVSSREFYLHNDVTFSPVSCVYVRYSSILQQGEVNVGDKTCYRDKVSVHLAFWVVELPCLSQTRVLWQFFYIGSCMLDSSNWNWTTVTQGCKVRTSCFVTMLFFYYYAACVQGIAA